MAIKNTTGKTTRKKNTSPTTDRMSIIGQIFDKAYMQAVIGRRKFGELTKEEEASVKREFDKMKGRPQPHKLTEQEKRNLRK